MCVPLGRTDDINIDMAMIICAQTWSPSMSQIWINIYHDIAIHTSTNINLHTNINDPYVLKTHKDIHIIIIITDVKRITPVDCQFISDSAKINPEDPAPGASFAGNGNVAMVGGGCQLMAMYNHGYSMLYPSNQMFRAP